MAVYFDHQVQTPQDASYTHDNADWHPKFPLLAVSSYNEATGGEVNIFFEEGEKSRETPLRKPSHKVSRLRWHPLKKILAVGWSSGDVTVWNLIDKGEIFPISPSPGNDITCLEWSSEGTRLIVADNGGMVLAYKADHRGCPQSAPFSKNKLKEPIRCCILRPPVHTALPEQPKPKPQEARRPSVLLEAVDEDAGDTLDDFGMKKNIGGTSQPAGRIRIVSSESLTFFLGGATGGVYCLFGSGVAEERFSVDRPIAQLLYYKERDVLLTLSEDLMLSQHKVSEENILQELARVKLSGRPQNLQLAWLEPGILAMSSMEAYIRLWDLDNEDNCILALASDRGYSSSDTVTCVAYCTQRSIIAAGTSLGNIAMWRPSQIVDEGLDKRWKLQLPVTLQNPVTQLEWAPSASMLAVCTSSEVFILKEQYMCAHMQRGTIAVQTSQKVVTLTKTDELVSAEYRPDMSIKGIFVSEQYWCCWDGRKIAVYESNVSGSGALVGSFACTSLVAALHGQNVYVADAGRVQVRTFQGTVKQSLLLADEENDPSCMDVNGSYLAVATTTGFLKIFDLSRREAKQQYHSKHVADRIKQLGSVASVRINCTGTCVSFTLRQGDGCIDPKLYIWEAESDSVIFYDLLAGRSDQDEYEEAESDSSRDCALRNRIPVECCWDGNDSRLLFSEAAPGSSFDTTAAPAVGDRSKSMIASFFVTPDHGFLLQDAFVSSPVCDRLIGAETPFIYFARKAEFIGDSAASDDLGLTEKPISRFVIRRTCRDFVGLENADEGIRKAMLNFSFYVTIGNMDEAFKAIKLIKSESVWENMAQMCVKTQRLDVAAVCLGNMGNARATRMLRKVTHQADEAVTKAACLAVHLGMLEDATRLYQSCKKFDMVSRIEQATNNWKKAIETGEKLDRVHLRNIYYNYAKHLEAVGAIQGAIEYYEKSDTHRFEVPRMLFENPAVLEQYVKKNKDPYLQRWWAQYLESLGEMEAAKAFYSSAKDYLSVVRLLCYLGDIDQAAAVASDSNDKAACYHLARQYENAGQFKEAVHFFTKACAYGSAIRLCKEHGMDDRIAQLALMSSPADMIEAAKFYENKRGHADKAVMLYHKAKMVARALDLAFRTEQFSALDLIAAELDANADPLVLERCAEFFMQNQQYTKAVQLLAYAKKHADAIELCIRRNVPITEQLVELLTPTKESIPDNVRRAKLLEQLADCCMQQGHYHYAAKKYTQAGSKIQAMRALLKSGDTEKIIFFANAARTKEIYIMAGNYLQTLDWKHDPDIMKHIVTFYTKGQAPESLAGFYDACAQIEIDDYRDYEKALTALQEAGDCLNRGQSRDSMQMEQKVAEVNRKISLIKQFLSIRGTYESDPAQAMKQLEELADAKNVNDAVRLGDIYAVLVIHNVKKENYKKAHACFEELRKRMPRLDVYKHMKPQIIERIYRNLDLPVPKLRTPDTSNDKQQNETSEDYVPEAASLKRRHDTNENGLVSKQ